ncbi:polymer-forming cytoskeletal protein [Amylibacter sp.]|jgi:cytoskeletal protein CcmA (bactofilin family)|nr:polymer-forming cytoskeletal protein [Paracoccaceae bacterium]MDB2474442.1 polymer-forming cytoskeletal protein [Amylibacter sp.]|tara:strand:- start:325 stop:720 length:396 start_codon:yes stop_codon:yes gene_type:complete
MFSNSTSDVTVSQNTNLDKKEQRHSVLHDGIVIQGDWQSDGIVEFGGKIIGDLTVDVLIVTGTGNVEGNVRARSVTIEGKLNGTIAAINVSLASTAILSGKVVAQKIEINSGANVEAELRATGKADTKALS